MTPPELPLAGRTVLVTRTPERAEALALRLRTLGATVLVAPVTATVPPPSAEALDAAVGSLRDYAWVAVTSVNAVEALRAAASPELSGAGRGGARARPDTPPPLTALSGAGRGGARVAPDSSARAAAESSGAGTPGAQPGPLWAAVGPATARALEAAGVQVALEASGTAADLVARFPASGQLSGSGGGPARPGPDTLVGGTAMSGSGGGPARPGPDTLVGGTAMSGSASGPARPGPDTLVGGTAMSGSAGGPARPGPDRLEEDGEARRVLLPLGDRARSVLADGLRALGWVVDVVVAYRTIPAPLPDDVAAAARDGRIDLAVVAAGSAARELTAQLGDATPPVVTIGQPSADAAAAAGLDVVGVAAHPTHDALAAAVVAALAPAPTRPAGRGDPVGAFEASEAGGTARTTARDTPGSTAGTTSTRSDT